jgi:nitrous oxidase accessory protein NosD
MAMRAEAFKSLVRIFPSHLAVGVVFTVGIKGNIFSTASFTGEVVEFKYMSTLLFPFRL